MHKWTCTDDIDGEVVEFTTHGIILDTLLDQFKRYLQGCGFVFGVDEYLDKVSDETQELINYVYVVTMERWGSRENHSYVLGVCSTFEQAEELSELEEIYRGGKYKRCIERFTVDKMPSKYDEEEI